MPTTKTGATRAQKKPAPAVDAKSGKNPGLRTFVALLRGVNVSGQKSVPMEKLRGVCEGLGWRSVRTYIQSGNVVFAAESRAGGSGSRTGPSGTRMVTEALAEALRAAIETAFGFNAAVLVRSADEMEAVLAENPYAAMKMPEGTRVYITYLASKPDPAAVAALKKIPLKADEFTLSGNHVYLLCRSGYGKTELSNAFFEKKIGVVATTRNLETTIKLAAMAREN